MVSPFTLPPTGFGPGSQPDPEGELQYLPMPSGMRIYEPHVPERADPAALALLGQMAAACDLAAAGAPGADFDLAGLTAGTRAALADALGQGEVSMRLRGMPALKVQESVFAGVWLLQGAGVERAEVGAVPQLAIARAHLPHSPALGPLARRRDGVVNAPALLAELLDKSRHWQPGLPPHVVNLSLLPHTPEDLDWLAEALGEGATTILSRGYGNCRITACAQPQVWRVQFYNSTDQLILDTFEVTAIPEVTLAAPEDLADSAARIRAVMEAIG